jgi:hypothetical protein
MRPMGRRPEAVGYLVRCDQVDAMCFVSRCPPVPAARHRVATTGRHEARPGPGDTKA